MVEKSQVTRLDASVIIATHNRAAILEQTLGHLAAQDTDGMSWEVIVVNNGSTDDTDRVLAEAQKKLPLVPLEEPNLGKNHALNKALAAVPRGELFIFTDDDVVPCVNWCKSLVSAARRYTDCSVLCGPVQLRLPPDTPKWIKTYAHESGPPHRGLYGRFEPEIDAGPVSPTMRPVGANFAVRAGSMAGLYYDATIGPRGKEYPMGSETEFLKRLFSKGEKLAFVPDARLEHVVRETELTVAALLNRSFRQGRGGVRMRIIEGELHNVPFLMGAPRYMWRELFVAHVRNLRSIFAGKGARLKAKARLSKLRGAFCELKLETEIQAAQKGHDA